MFKNRYYAAKAMIASGAMAVTSYANAALDTAGVKTSLETAQGTGETVGGYVIAVVAGLVVVGVIIALVRKV